MDALISPTTLLRNLPEVLRAPPAFGQVKTVVPP